MKRLGEPAADIFWMVLCMLFVYVWVYGRACLLAMLQPSELTHDEQARATVAPQIPIRPAGQD